MGLPRPRTLKGEIIMNAPGPAAEAAVNVNKLGYVAFETPDVDRLIDYYTSVLDLTLVEKSPEVAFLTIGFDHHCVVITRGDTARGRTAVGYEIAEPLDDAVQRLRDAGHEVERRSDIGPGTPDVLVLAEPVTGMPLHLMTAQEPSGVWPTALRPTKLGHISAYTPELEPVEKFYREVLGFRWSDRVEDFFVFLRCGPDHHSANFLTSTTFEGIHHIAYEFRDPGHLITMVDHLSKNGYRLDWGPGRHGPGHNLFTYHKDPDGHSVELFTEIDLMQDEARGYWEPRPWHETFPVYPKTWEVTPDAANLWGPDNASYRAR
jgi:catechol-2,3-dioxygenase